MKKVLLLVFLFGISIGFSQDQPIDVPTITVKIGVGDLVQFENVSVQFIKVLEDSRCPKDVTCVWAGQAKVLVEVLKNGQDPMQIELLFGGRQKKNILFSEEGYKLSGVSLSPYPTTYTVGKMDYILLVSEVID